ncbi:MAG: hypothetical protein EAY75_14765, partial [Bacteroidetes bacterium]
MQFVLLLFQHNHAWLAPENGLPLSSLNLPNTIEAVHNDVCWQLQVISYEAHSTALVAEVSNYNYPFQQFLPQQLQWLDTTEITSIRFLRLSTPQLLWHVVFQRVNPDLPGSADAPPAPQPFTPSFTQPQATPHTLAPATEPASMPLGIIWQQTYKVPLQNIRFGFGNASMVFYVEPLMQQEAFHIENIHLRPEFDAVKDYFWKKLGGKQIEVTVWVEHLADGTYQNHAKAKALAKIDANFIESIRFELVRKVFKTRIDAEINKALFTPDELLGQFNRNLPGMGSFYDDSSNLFDDLLSVQSAKHYKHLRYLSTLHAADTMKLRFVLQPFSFIFLIKGQHQFHLVWETLDSQEATYLWHTEKNLQALKVQLNQ